MTEKVKGFVPATFNDAGTDETFEGDKEHSFSAGAYENYRTAGLIADAPAKADPIPPAKTAKD